MWSTRHPDQTGGPAGFRILFDDLRGAFPDLTIAVEHMVAAGDDVAFACTVTGSHQGEFQGHPATGRGFSVRGVQIGRFVDAKLAERWGSSDQLGILTKLGLV